MKKIKNMLAVLSAVVTCVSASVLPLSNCFAADAEAVESVTSETASDESVEMNTNQIDIAKKLRLYVNEAKIPAKIGMCDNIHVQVYYNCKDKDVPDKINAFAEKNNIYKKVITYVVDRTSLGDPTGKITDLKVIMRLINGYAEQNDIPIHVNGCAEIYNLKLAALYPALPCIQISYRKADEAYEGEIEEKINKFIAENNIYEYSTIYYVNSMSAFQNEYDLRTYIKEAKIPAFIYPDCKIVYDSSDEAYVGEVKDKITAFAEKNNYFECEISYTDINTDLLTDSGAIADVLRKYIVEAKIPAGVMASNDGHVYIHYKCSDEDVPDKINAFIDKKNIYKKGITYVVNRTALGDPTGKITDYKVICRMIHDYVQDNNIPATICDCTNGTETEITNPYSQFPAVEVSYRKADEAYEGEIKEKIDKFIAENNIYEYSTIYYVNSESINSLNIDLLEDYIKEANIPATLYGYRLVYDSSDEAYEGEIKDKINAFADENNFFEYGISYYDTKNVPETTNGKITAPYIIWDMLAQFAKDNGFEADMHWYKEGLDHGEHIEFDVDPHTVSGSQYDMYDKIVDFIVDNNIDRDMVLISNLSARPLNYYKGSIDDDVREQLINDAKLQDAESDLSNIKGSTPIATGSNLEKNAKWGDVNTDGDVDISDVVKLNMYLLDQTANPVSEQGLVNANCAYDDTIDTSDASIINNYISMMINYSELGPKN